MLPCRETMVTEGDTSKQLDLSSLHASPCVSHVVRMERLYALMRNYMFIISNYGKVIFNYAQNSNVTMQGNLGDIR